MNFMSFPFQRVICFAIVWLVCNSSFAQAEWESSQQTPTDDFSNVSGGERYPLFPADSSDASPSQFVPQSQPVFQSQPVLQSQSSSERPLGPLPEDSRINSLPLPTRVARAEGVNKPPEGTDNRQVGSTEFTLAEQPKFGEHADHGKISMDAQAKKIEPLTNDFSPDPIDPHAPYSPGDEMWIYEGKKLNANRRPLLELGKPWYQLGELAPSYTFLGQHNPVSPQFLIYGDYRMAYASAQTGSDTISQMAFALNMNFDLRLTGTERLTAFVAPLDNGARNTRWLMDDDEFVSEFEPEVQFGMLEGDLGALVGGWTGQTLPFDLPFAVGVMPLLVQNGVWMEDAILGVAATIPARHSTLLDISNMDITFFAGYDNINSPAFEGDDDAAKMYGMFSFLETCGGYLEFDYAYLEDRTARDRSYHNIGVAFSRRYGRWISNSVRVIVNAGQSTQGGPNTADGAVILIENSLITSRPSNFVPYFNFFAGFDRPQSAARAGAAGGILRNTGILFESDGMTGFPTLDATANDTVGGAIGLNILTEGFTQQLVVEMAFLHTIGNDPNRNAFSDQYGLGARYQIPLSNSWIFAFGRHDGIPG